MTFALFHLPPGRTVARDRIRKVVCISAFALTLAGAASGQNTQFAFDANGNLLAWTGESIASPKIVAQPQTQVVRPGEFASFSVVAANTRGLAYQWQFNGTNLPGATNDALLLTNVGALAEGLYSVVLANSSGSVTSAPAALFLDADGDGLPDSWELAYFGNLIQNASGDFDGDGVSNEDEFRDSTDPTNSASAKFRLTLSSNGGMVEVVPAKLSYTNGEPVTLIATAVAPEAFRGWTGDLVSPSNPATFFMNGNKTIFAHFQSTVIHWTSTASGSWHNPLNWKPPLVPTEGDDVILQNSVTITLDEDAHCRNLSLPAGTLTGAGTLTIHGDAIWTGGTMSGSGRTLIAPGGSLTLNNNLNGALSRTLEVGGVMNWIGSALLALNNAVITNRPGGLVHFQNAQPITFGGGSPRIDNAGTFRKSNNSGTTTIPLPFNNFGVVELQTGILLQSGSFLNNGAVVLFPATTYRLTGGGSASGNITNPVTGLVDLTGGTFTLNPGAELVGDGLYRINGATLTCNTDAILHRLDLASGTLNGSGMVTVLSALNWTVGTMSGSGRTIIPPAAVLTLNNNLNSTLGRTLEIGGTMNWTGSAGFFLNGGVITNRPGALLQVQNAASFNHSGGSPRIDNAGTFRKSANAGTTAVGVPFNNFGDVELQTGTLLQNGSFLNNGTVVLAPSTTYRLAGGGSATGPFINPATAVVDWIGGTFTLHPGAELVGDGLYRISGATLTCNTDAILHRLDLASGTLNGSGMVTVANALNWTVGTMSGSGRTIIPPDAVLNLNNNLNSTLGRTLEIGGTLNWTGSALLSLNNAVITNRPGGLVHFQNAQPLNFGGGSPRIDNAGTFRKSSHSGTTTVPVPFNNFGAVELQAGTLQHSGAFVNDGVVTLSPGTTHRFTVGGSANGPFTNPATALVDWTGGTFTLNPGAELVGDGLYRINGATLTCNTGTSVQNLNLLSGTLGGPALVTMLNAMNWTAGTMSGSGRTVIAPGALLTFHNVLNGALSRTLEIGGTMLWTGSALLALNNIVITNRPGGVLHVQNAQSFNHGGGSPRIDNAGTFRKSANTGTTTVNVPFNNYGTMDLRSGIVAVNGGFTAGGGASLNCALGGTTAGTGHARLQRSGTITLDGALSVELLPGFVPATNDSFTVVSATTRSGTFTEFSYPTNRVTMTLSNTATAVVLTVGDVFPIPQPVLLAPELAGADILLRWTATSNVTYQLEHLGDAGSTNWTVVPGHVVTSSNLAAKLDTLTSSNRLYRVRVLP